MIETVQVTGRTKIPLSKKLNVLWWFGNDPEPSPPDWYLPGKAQWWRVFCWYCRNPLVNFNDYVVGVCDRNFWITGVAPVTVPDQLTIGKEGFKWSIIWRWVPRPFLSYTGKKRAFLGNRRILWHIGWEPGGSLANKFNITKDGA